MNHAALEWVEYGIGPLGVGVGVFGKWLLDWKIRKAAAQSSVSESGKLDAEAVKIIAETAVSLVAPLKSEIEELTCRVKALEDENTAATGKLRRAITYIRDLLVWISLHVSDEYQPPQTPFGLDI